jgi:hypothetical protein
MPSASRGLALLDNVFSANLLQRGQNVTDC